jgi:hypothetical protein
MQTVRFLAIALAIQHAAHHGHLFVCRQCCTPLQRLCYCCRCCCCFLQVRQKLAGVKADCFLATTLDEVAWLYSLRGSDVPYNPGAPRVLGSWVVLRICFAIGMLGLVDVLLV